MGSKLLIGTDEAGYGPNLGPLVISATAWEVPRDMSWESLWAELSDVLTCEPVRNDKRLFLADSKKVYSPAGGLLDLETGVLSCLATLSIHPQTDVELGSALASAGFSDVCREQPEGQLPETDLPLAANIDEINDFCLQLRQQFAESGIRLLQVVSRIIYPPEFNDLVTKAESKGVILSQETMGLVRRLCEEFLPSETQSPDDSERAPAAGSLFGGPEFAGGAEIYCDKHGGRNRYDQLISELFDDRLVFRQEESMHSSRYRLGSMQFCFRTKAEAVLPVALASMVSKYIREVLMVRLNAFWQNQVPDLKPTKGYPLDAKRFRDQIAAEAEALGIDESRFWRIR